MEGGKAYAELWVKLLNLKDSSSICLRFILHSKVREVPATLPPGIGKLQTEAMYFDECGSNLTV